MIRWLLHSDVQGLFFVLRSHRKDFGRKTSKGEGFMVNDEFDFGESNFDLNFDKDNNLW